jgi:Uma2 family endonuclease
MALVNTSPLVKTYTLEEFWELPDPPDRAKLELIAGVLYMSPPPGYAHDDIVTRLNRLLTMELVRIGDPGKLRVPRAAIWTSTRTYLEPDLFYLSAETEAQLDPKRRTTADLVIEVTSPGSAIYDRNTKADTYAALGVKELWLVDEVEENVELRTLVDERFAPGQVFAKGELLNSLVLPSLAIPITRIFED